MLPSGPLQFPAGLQGFRDLDLPRKCEVPSVILSWASTLLQSPPTRRAAAPADAKTPATAAPPLRFSPLQRLPVQGSDLLLTPAGLSVGTFRFSQPLGALFRPAPADHLSGQIRSWGYPLQSLSPLAKPYTISDAAALWPLGPSPRPRIQTRRYPKRLTPPRTTL
jgi:hypothetical protein